MIPKYGPGDKVRFRGKTMYVLWICSNDPGYKLNNPLYAVAEKNYTANELVDAPDFSTVEAYESEMEPDIIDILKRIMRLK